jgi:hypothetical protein
MTDDEARAHLRNLLRLMGRRETEIVDKMTRREISQGVVLRTRLEALAADVNEWLTACSERMLQDEANAET